MLVERLLRRVTWMFDRKLVKIEEPLNYLEAGSCLTSTGVPLNLLSAVRRAGSKYLVNI